MDPLDLSGFSGTVPVFPLPNVVLFPQTLLPLHVFEPRYRAMTRDALKGERLIVMALLKPGWESDYYGTPPVHDVAGMGRILHEREFEDGRYNLLVYGVARVRIEQFVSDAPYRCARVRPLEDRIRSSEAAELQRKRQALLAVYAALMRRIQGESRPHIDPNLSLGALCDALTAFLDIGLEEKQGLLEELDIAARVNRVTDWVKRAPFIVKDAAREAPEKPEPPPFDPTVN